MIRMARVWFTEDGELKTEMIPEQEIYVNREKLVPFDIEEARKDPSRVRWAWGGKPDAVLVARGSIELRENGAEHAYDERHYDRLRLVAAPKVKRYKIVRSFPRPETITLRREGTLGFSEAPADVRDVKYDKATGVMTVEYYE